MNLPELISTKEFKRTFRGYNENEVDMFLDEILEGYETVFKENEVLKNKIAMYSIQVEKYNSIEDTLKETLVTAQGAAEDTTNAANKKARIIVQEAELQAKQMIDKTNSQVVEIKNEYESLLKDFKMFRMKFKSLLQDEIRNVDDIFIDIKTNDEILEEEVKKESNQAFAPVLEENTSPVLGLRNETPEPLGMVGALHIPDEEPAVSDLEVSESVLAEEYEINPIYTGMQKDVIDPDTTVTPDLGIIEADSLKDEEKESELTSLMYGEIDSENISVLEDNHSDIVTLEDIEKDEELKHAEISSDENNDIELREESNVEEVNEGIEAEIFEDLNSVNEANDENTDTSIEDFIIEKNPSENSFSYVPDIEKTVDIFRKVEKELANFQAQQENGDASLVEIDFSKLDLTQESQQINIEDVLSEVDSEIKNSNVDESELDKISDESEIIEVELMNNENHNELTEEEVTEDSVEDSEDTNSEVVVENSVVDEGESEENKESKETDGIDLTLTPEEEENPEFAALKQNVEFVNLLNKILKG